MTVEKASIRLRCRWARLITAPTSAVTTPTPTSRARTPDSCTANAGAKTVQYERAAAYRPSSTITPENSTHTGVGATAWASASQKWNGTTAPLTRNPNTTKTKATTTRPSGDVGGDAAPDRRQVQRAGAGVQQGDARQDHQRADAVRHGEVERALQRSGFLGLVAREPVGGDAHQLEEDEHVEQVAAQAEPAHRRQEHEDERVEEHADGVEVAPREDERGRDERGADGGHPGAERVDDEADTQHDLPAGRPVAEPVDDRPVERLGEQQQAEDRHGERHDGGEEVGEPPLGHRVQGDEQRGADERHHDRERSERRRRPLTPAVR